MSFITSSNHDDGVKLTNDWSASYLRPTVSSTNRKSITIRHSSKTRDSQTRVSCLTTRSDNDTAVSKIFKLRKPKLDQKQSFVPSMLSFKFYVSL